MHWLSVRETNGTSTSWWWVDPPSCRAEIPGDRPQGGADLCTISSYPHSDVPEPRSCALGPHTANTHRTSDTPLAHLQPLQASDLCFSAHPDLAMEKQCCCLHPGELNGIHWGRTEMHWDSPLTSHLTFPLSLTLHHTWHSDRPYLLFKGFKHTSQATAEVPTDV